MSLNNALNEISNLADLTDASIWLNSTPFYSSQLGVDSEKIVFCTNPKYCQFCITEDCFFHISCGLTISIMLKDISKVFYHNKILHIYSNDGKKFSYFIGSIFPKIEEYDKLGNIIVDLIIKLSL